MAPCDGMRDHAGVPRKLSTTNYPASARKRLGDAVTAARVAAGYMYRTTFAKAAGIKSIRSLDLLENGDPGVGQAILILVARALPGWHESTPRVILEGGPIPEPPPKRPSPQPGSREWLIERASRMSPEQWLKVVAEVVRRQEERRARGDTVRDEQHEWSEKP